MTWTQTREDDLKHIAPSLQDDVHIWMVRCSDFEPKLTEFVSDLNDQEKARAKRFRFERDRSRFIIRRAIQRAILASYVALHPKEILYQEDTSEKPEIRFPYGGIKVEFNTTNSGDLFLIAIRQEGAVGIDVEEIKDQSSLDLVARQNFTAKERTTLEAASVDSWLASFYRIWTQKEAMVKALGKGLSMPVLNIEVPAEGGAVKIHQEIVTSSTKWHSVLLDPFDDTIAALAVEGAVPAIQLFHLS